MPIESARFLRWLLIPIAVFIDVLAVVLTVAIAVIALTGGGVLVFHGHRISATGVDNPLVALTLLMVIRYVAMRRLAWFGVSAWSPHDLDGAAVRLASLAGGRVGAMSARRAARVVGLAVVTALTIKLLLAYANPGFFSGDDVEIQEMALRPVWHADWPIWDLRNAFFPMLFVFPVEKLLALAGVMSAKVLVFGGRSAVAAWSSLAVWLVWKGGRREFPTAPGWAMVAALLFAVGKLHIAFGSSELPRPVSTVAVLGAFVLLQREETLAALIAALLLGVACCFRFSEAIFVPVAVLQLLSRRRLALSGALFALSGLTALAILGTADWLYWGGSFHSLRAAVDYTLVQKLSSRGYQNAAWYLLHAPEWVNPAVLVLGIAAVVRAPRIVDLWVWLPLFVLSCLPHKEARYAIPVLPFLCLSAAREVRDQVRRIQSAEPSPPRWRALALVALLVAGVVQDVGHWRLPRTNDDTVFATRANAMVPRDVPVAAEQMWRLGGHLYMRPHPLIDLDPARLDDPRYLSKQISGVEWIVLDERTAGDTAIVTSLRERHYARVPLVVTGSRYQLWRPAALSQ